MYLNKNEKSYHKLSELIIHIHNIECISLMHYRVMYSYVHMYVHIGIYITMYVFL